MYWKDLKMTLKIKYQIDPYPKEKAEFSAQEDTELTRNTVLLLYATFNGTTQLKKIESGNLRSQLLKEVRKFQDMLFEYDDGTYIEDEKEVLRNRIIRELQPASGFTAFKRWIIRQNEVLFEEFSSYCE